ncbi:AAA family ATPase [Lactobacillus sp. DCY120]|uniref:AAA family ATPase n=1 Tax=Bombilactobacillus apium TaxID=2675299 RepID=A0A850R1Y1_9LACO|nr:RNA polymerase recycling motor HelD [Bombilactobacillus apium]NVY96360.1 AAA family ATPase [Bombilactobacillus apium]
MSSFPNESRAAEQTRVDHVETMIQQQLITTAQNLSKAQQERRKVEVNFSSNTRANYIETDDIIETNATLQQQKQLLAGATTNEDILTTKEKELHLLAGSPYFGRIDIQEDGEPDTLYIGMASLNDHDQNFWVYDWRSPIAAIYYNGTLGRVQYTTPVGPQTVELQRKRQFSIQAGKIKNMFDTNETIGDNILKSVLGQASSPQMHNIVATIQQAQNQIIRDVKTKVLIVQGAAGSGKTSTIMQRIAFLLYHSRRQVNADQMLLFSPNNLFSNYIAAVLPSLGEKNLRQVTLQAFLAQRLHGLQVQSLFERFEQEQTPTNPETQALRQFQESLEFVRQLEAFAKKADLTSAFQSLLFEGQVFFSAAEMIAIYQEFPTNLLTTDKLVRLKNTLIRRLQAFLQEEAHQDWVLTAIDDLSERQYAEIINTPKLRAADFNTQQQHLAQALVHQKYYPVYEAIYNNYFYNPYQLYKQFLQEVLYPQPQVWQAMITAYQLAMETHKISLAHATAVLYLQQLLTGTGRQQQIKQLFLDEMQDYSPLQLAYIQHSFPQAKLTLLGDLAQNLYQGSQDQSQLAVLEELFTARKTKVISLQQSYRSTAAITNFAKQLIPQGEQIQAFNRPGVLPTWWQTSSEQLAAWTLHCAQEAREKYETVAVITKTNAQVQELQKLWASQDKVSVLQENDHQIPTGIVLVPIYLAKGLEFDAVIGYAIQAPFYQSKSDQAILYTLATRALHDLQLISAPHKPRWAKELDQKTYQARIAQ